MSNYQTPYQALGEAGIRDLATTFYAIMDTLPEATDIRAMHGAELGPMIEKLGDYLCGWMGGPPHYADKHGTVCLTSPHEHYWIGPRERDQWLLCMELAMDQLNTDPDVRAMLKEPLFRVADAVRNREHSLDVDNPDIIAIG